MVKNLIQNCIAGFSVSLVSMPIAISLATAAGISPEVGIITAFWAGISAALFGNNNFIIIGPTASLLPLIIAANKNFLSVSTITLSAGVLIIFFSLLNIEKFIVFISAPVIQGLLVGIALIIIKNQLPHAIGLFNREMELPLTDIIISPVYYFRQIHIPTLTTFIVFFFAYAFWNKKYKNVPGTIIITPLGILIGYLSNTNFLPFELHTLQQSITTLTPKIFILTYGLPTLQEISTSIPIALVAIIEVLIAGKITNNITKTTYNAKKEITSLGIANIISALMGGIPATASLARTSLNIKMGAQNKLAAATSSMFLIAISFFFLPFFKHMPLCMIATILIFVAIKMLEVKKLLLLCKVNKQEFLIASLVAFLTVYHEPLSAILWGSVMAMMLFMTKLSKGSYEVNVSTPNEKNNPTITYSIKGQLAYINAQSHLTEFERAQTFSNHVVLNLKDLEYLDSDGIETINQIVHNMTTQNKTLSIQEANSTIKHVLHKNNDFRKLKIKGHIIIHDADASRHCAP